MATAHDSIFAISVPGIAHVRDMRADFVGIPPSAGDLYAAVAAHGWATARAMIDDALVKWPAARIASESTLNAVAYRLLAAHAADAIAVFAEVTRRFPGSANAWDSLGEALEGAHQLAAARDATEHGLAVVAGDPSPQRAAIEQSLKARQARLAK